MKKVILLAVGALALASVYAFADMPGSMPGHGSGGDDMMHGDMHSMHAQMMGPGTGDMHGGMAGHGSAAKAKGDNSASSLAFQAINQKMHEGMDIAFSGDADVDFIKGMIPHHQGAIDMAKTVLAFGKDPEVRKLAEAIISSQESEVTMMKGWLAKHAR